MRVFLDSNILVYANDSRDLKKQQVAVSLVESCQYYAGIIVKNPFAVL